MEQAALTESFEGMGEFSGGASGSEFVGQLPTRDISVWVGS